MRRVLVALGGLAAAWLVACAVLFVWPPAETGSPARADAVVVLSGDPARLPAAEGLIRRHVAPVLALSTIPWVPWAEKAGGLCVRGRYAGARVLCFAASPYSTQGEAETVTRLARANGWRSVVVVSSTYHLTRARMLFSRCFSGKLSFVGAPSAWYLLPEDWFLETGKLLYQTTVETAC